MTGYVFSHICWPFKSISVQIFCTLLAYLWKILVEHRKSIFFSLEFISGVLKWYSRDWYACIYVMKVDQITGKNVGNL